MSKRRLAALGLVLSLPLALIVTELRQYAHNTLNTNGRWVSAKPLMQIPLMGARQFLVTRNALARNRLDLRAWHGYNEVYFHRPVQLGSLELSLRLQDQAHLSILLGRTADGFRGVRLSRHPDFPSVVFTGERSGRFVDKIRLELEIDDAWHRARIEPRDDYWELSLDGEAVARFDWRSLPDGLIGFRSGFSRAEVDDVRIRDEVGNLVVQEGFRHRSDSWRTFLTSLGGIYLLLALFVWLATRGDRERNTRSLHWIVLLVLMACFGGLLALGFDVYVWSGSYIYQEQNPNAPAPSALLVRLESWRQVLFGTESVETIDLPVAEVASRITRWDLRGEFEWPGPKRWNRFAAYTSAAAGRPRYVSNQRLGALEPDKDAFRVAFVGTSQGAGVGAEVVEDAMVGRLHGALSAALNEELESRSIDLQLFNLSVAGSYGQALLGYFERRWIDLEPDLVIISLSFNDRNLGTFKASLESFIELDRSRGVETLLVVEPKSADKADPGVRQRQELVRQIGQAQNVPVLDLEAYLARPAVRDSGFIWWDQVHMTSYGQGLAADWLSEQIEPYAAMQLRQRRPDRPASSQGD